MYRIYYIGTCDEDSSFFFCVHMFVFLSFSVSIVRELLRFKIVQWKFKDVLRSFKNKYFSNLVRFQHN